MTTLSILFLSFFSTAFDPLAFFSENQKKGLDEYRTAIGVTVNGNDNSSIGTFNDNFLSKNRCFKKLAEDFYLEIRKNDVATHRNAKRVGRPQDAPSFSIDDRVLEPGKNNGIFWETALKYANGNKNLAMSLIGVCGHDNMLQSNIIICPTEFSNIYYPESLGKNIDISAGIKRKIIAAQGDSGSGLYVPSKYYHIIGAATTACLLLRRGVPEALAQVITLAAVNAYRSGRLCESLLQPGFSDFKMKDKENLDLALNKGSQSDTWKNMSAKVKGLSVKPVNIQRKKFEIALSYLDAQSYLINNVQIMQECRQAKTSGQLMAYLKSWDNNAYFKCPEDMDIDRCDRLKHRIYTWAVDREWTEAQHMVGFNFAKKNCPSDITTGNEIEIAACELENHGQGVPGSTPTTVQ